MSSSSQLSSWESRTRPLVVGAASCFDLSGRLVPDRRAVLRDERSIRLVWVGMLGMFAATASLLAVGAGLVLAGVPEAGGLAILGMASAPSLTFFASRDLPPPSRLVGLHVSAVVSLVAVVSGLVCFFDAGRVGSAVVFGAVFLLGAALFALLWFRRP